MKLSELQESTRALALTPLMVTSVLDFSRVGGVEEGTVASVGYTVAVAPPCSDRLPARWIGFTNLGKVSLLLTIPASGVLSGTFVMRVLTVPAKVALSSSNGSYSTLRITIRVTIWRGR